MLYDGAIRFALQGKEAIEREDYENVYEKLTRAQHIVLEMETGLRPEVHREICEQMSALYGFVYRKLVDGSVHKDASAVEDAILRRELGITPRLVVHDPQRVFPHGVDAVDCSPQFDVATGKGHDYGWTVT